MLAAARARLERSLNDTLGGVALVYESHVVDIRKRAPLVWSVRVLQAIAQAAIVAAVVGGIVVMSGQSWWVTVSYVTATATAGLSCGLSYRDMRRARTVADATLADVLP